MTGSSWVPVLPHPCPAKPPVPGVHTGWGQPKGISAHLGNPAAFPHLTQRCFPSVHLLGPVALPYRRLYAAAAGSRAGPERAPRPPCAVRHRRLSLFGHAHPKPAVLRARGRDGKGGFASLSHYEPTVRDQPSWQDSRLLISQPLIKCSKDFCKQIKFTFCLPPPYFFLSAPSNEAAKASCRVHGSDLWEDG